MDGESRPPPAREDFARRSGTDGTSVVRRCECDHGRRDHV